MVWNISLPLGLHPYTVYSVTEGIAGLQGRVTFCASAIFDISATSDSPSLDAGIYLFVISLGNGELIEYHEFEEYGDCMTNEVFDRGKKNLAQSTLSQVYLTNENRIIQDLPAVSDLFKTSFKVTTYRWWILVATHSGDIFFIDHTDHVSTLNSGLPIVPYSIKVRGNFIIMKEHLDDGIDHPEDGIQDEPIGENKVLILKNRFDDSDNDWVPDQIDNCVNHFNPNQELCESKQGSSFAGWRQWNHGSGIDLTPQTVNIGNLFQLPVNQTIQSVGEITENQSSNSTDDESKASKVSKDDIAPNDSLMMHVGHYALISGFLMLTCFIASFRWRKA